MNLYIKSLIFTILQPGVVAIFIPYVLHIYFDSNYQVGVVNWVGIPIFIAGLFIMFWCIYAFILTGKGTLSPAAPTKQLVTRGLYNYSRNPMYVGVLLMIIGEALYFGSVALFAYLMIVTIGFHLFITLAEEPRLQREFGLAYKEYKQRVRRWV